MAKSEIKQSRTVTLELSEDEARWLKGIMQNPIGCEYDHELIEDQKHRASFWKALENID